MIKLLLAPLFILMGCSSTTLESSQNLYKGKGLEVHEKRYKVSGKQRVIAIGPPSVYRYTDVEIKTKSDEYEFYGYKDSKIAKVCLCSGKPWLFVNEHRMWKTKEPFAVYFHSNTKCKDYKKSNPQCEGWSKVKSNSQQGRREIDKKVATCDCRIMEPKIKRDKGWSSSRLRNWKYGYPDIGFIEAKDTAKPNSKKEKKYFDSLLLTVKGCLAEVERTQSSDLATNSKVHFVAKDKNWEYWTDPKSPIFEKCLDKRKHLKDLFYNLIAPNKKQMTLIVQIQYK